MVIHCKTGKEEWVTRNLKKIEGVKEVAGVLSLYDIIAKVEAKDSLTLENIITKQIRKIQYIHTTMTLLVIEKWGKS
ncbi:MAG: Lrp/AsnC ligand binding domain-containing protein [Nitrosopumilaceae archaeon]